MPFLFFCYILLFYFTYKKDSFKYLFEQLANIWKILVIIIISVFLDNNFDIFQILINIVDVILNNLDIIILNES